MMAIEDVDLKIPLKAADAAAVSNLTDGIVATKEMGTYVLKPFRSPKSKKLKTAVVFVPRLTHFDIENERSKNNEFRVRLPPLIYGCHRSKHNTDSFNYNNRDSSHSFGCHSSYGQSARTFEA
jgi:hypothetical protein